jgi:hypothetical protein
VAELPAGYLDLYTLAVEMADRISARRGLANTFFVTVNTGLLALLGSRSLPWYVGAAGIVLSLVWWALLKSYRDLNAAKYDVIHAMEERLPVRIYRDEWSTLKREPIRFALKRSTMKSWVAQYRELGSVERVVPWVFAALYLIAIASQVQR